MESLLLDYINAFNDPTLTDEDFCALYGFGADDYDCLDLRDSLPNMDLIYVEYFDGLFLADIYVEFDLEHSIEYTFIVFYYDAGDEDIRLWLVEYTDENGHGQPGNGEDDQGDTMTVSQLFMAYMADY